MKEVTRFDLKDKLYQKSVFNKIDELKKKSSIYHLVIDLDPTTSCNLKCKHCISADLLNKKEFSKSQLLNLANEFIEIGVKAVILTGGGEPLLNRNIPYFISTLKEANIKIGLVTNGILIPKYLDSLKLIDWIRISVDAGSESTFYKLKLVNKFNDVIESIKLLNRDKKCTVGFSFLVINNEDATNIKEIYDAAVIAKEIGCDYFELKNKFDMSHKNIMPPDKYMEILKDQLVKIRDLETHDYRIYANYNISNIVNDNGKIDKKCNKCYIANFRTVVTPSGAYFCSYHRGNDIKKYGDINKNSFRECWESREKENIYVDTNPNHDCRFQCARSSSNLEIEKIISSSRNVVQNNILDDYDLFI
ncbi:cyclic pyranopterin monophosphate synthase [Clostridium puniceum]|uniref:Cyclic pyranopterin monophosphate synthase n=1 Tax=Clostridium puniceum TaxID=29367 RepID=A0A1S8T091_9CLOT|nr:radical SAM protein [Clostridium puniceum]OOM71138.1 cyclic pyranopterin monophosphate synthase [Clostridium puniceum]